LTFQKKKKPKERERKKKGTFYAGEKKGKKEKEALCKEEGKAVVAGNG